MSDEIELQEGDGCYVVFHYHNAPAQSRIEGPFKLGAPDKRTGNFRVSTRSGQKQFAKGGWPRSDAGYSVSLWLYRADDPKLRRIRCEIDYARQVQRLHAVLGKAKLPMPPELRSVTAVAAEVAGIADLIEALERRLVELQKAAVQP